MKTAYKISACVAAAAVALTMAVFTMAGFSPRQTAKQPPREAGYVLGESGGNIAVYRAGDLTNPVTVTNIELTGLREADRAMIRAGVLSGTESELLMLLEDLGS